jgi:hypothetical protein
MKSIAYLFVLGSLLLFTSATTSPLPTTTQEAPVAKKRQFYQLKTYTFATDEQMAVTEAYLRDAYLPALQRMGIGPVGVFKPRPGEEAPAKKLYVLIPFTSLKQFVGLEEKLAKDAAHAAAGRDYLTASHEAVPYERIESALLRAFSGMPTLETPDLTGPRADRVYELRSYEGPTEAYYQRKVEMFNTGGEIELFESLGFGAVFFAETLSGGQMPNLVYMTTFPDMASRDAHWKAFVESAKWKEIVDLPQYQNTVSHADIYLLYPTAYSGY